MYFIGVSITAFEGVHNIMFKGFKRIIKEEEEEK